MFTFEIKNLTKIIGTKTLFENVDFKLFPNEKIGFIGRNGEGKSTLLNILNGNDSDFTGEIHKSKNVKILFTKQEHHDVLHISPLEYIASGNFAYKEIKDKLISYEKEPEVAVTLDEYCELINLFAEKDFYSFEDKIVSTLEKYGLNKETLDQLSGGQKRIVEMIKVSISDANIVLMDEPTNHLDYMQKDFFLELLNKLDGKTCLIVSHDRDVLGAVTKILELKDKKFHDYKGNYDAYIAQNKLNNLSKITDYEQRLKKAYLLERQQKKVLKSNHATSKSTKVILERIERSKAKATENLEKPDFWIDQQSVKQMEKEDTAKYEKYKTTNIEVKFDSGRIIHDYAIHVKNLEIGYDKNIALFESLSLRMNPTDRIEIRGVNGAGKSSFIKLLIHKYKLERDLLSDEKNFALPEIINGSIQLSKKLDIGVYEQEFHSEELNQTIADIIEKEYYKHGKTIDNNVMNSILARYLFEPMQDKFKKLSQLSGGQKARIQLIKLLITSPNLLILDEPTNHLDLPSIEELEEALKNYKGGIIYISHDNAFRKALGGQVIEIKKNQ